VFISQSKDLLVFVYMMLIMVLEFFLTFMVLWIVFLFGSLAFWIWMLVDCLKKKRFEDKLIWVLVLIFLNVMGAVLYWFLVKGKRK